MNNANNGANLGFENQLWAADCNGDDQENIIDAIGIVNVILGLGECEP